MLQLWSSSWSGALKAEPNFMSKRVAVHAVSGEPGGDEALRERLAARGCAGLSFAVHSDPEHTLVPGPKENLFLEEPKAASAYGEGHEDYSMLQPALVVLDGMGKVKQRWSWKTMDVQPPTV